MQQGFGLLRKVEIEMRLVEEAAPVPELGMIYRTFC